jgi:hypothetical protein
MTSDELNLKINEILRNFSEFTATMSSSDTKVIDAEIYINVNGTILKFIVALATICEAKPLSNKANELRDAFHHDNLFMIVDRLLVNAPLKFYLIFQSHG